MRSISMRRQQQDEPDQPDQPDQRRGWAEAVNTLTARWLERIDPADALASGIGVWPLLALIADPADGAGRAELASALGIEPEAAIDAARDLIATLDACEAVHLATGLWTLPDLVVHDAWASRLPDGTRGHITGVAQQDAVVLNAWANERTGGRIPTFPLKTDPSTRLVLASALLVETQWAQPFTSRPLALDQGPWADAGPIEYLTRTTTNLDDIRVVEGECGSLTDMTVVGRDDVDVHLVLAEEHVAPARALAAGASIVTKPGGVRGTAFTEEHPGPGITSQRSQASAPTDQLQLATVGFAHEAEHDLLKAAEVLGLRTVSDRTRGHFPGIADEPLAVGAARQSIMARFHARGFEAAAVTALSMTFGAASPPRMYEIRTVSAAFTRPFAFYATHRPTGLVLVAGWV
ncbi:hypothetical protein KDL01_05090, partial [Actinospica durhamensis]